MLNYHELKTETKDNLTYKNEDFNLVLKNKGNSVHLKYWNLFCLHTLNKLRSCISTAPNSERPFHVLACPHETECYQINFLL
jgi:hypothetical protein